MCTTPVYRPNFNKPLYGGLPELACPCGKCQECAEVQSIDFQLRAMALYNNLVDAKINFSVYFVTFTFAPENVPFTHVAFKEKEDKFVITPYKLKCFNHEYLKKFKNSLRKHYDRLGLHRPDYLFSCEYGGYHEYRDSHGRLRFSQGLPHYHGIIFIYENIDYKEFKTLIETYWTYGFTKDIRLTKYLKDDGTNVRNTLNCIKYVCKYIGKYFSKCPSIFNDDRYLFDFPLFQIKPRVFTSNGFGSCLSKNLTDKNYRDNELLFWFDKKCNKYKIPSYIRRRYFNKTLQNVSFVYERDIKCINDIVPFPDFSRLYNNGVSSRFLSYCKRIFGLSIDLFNYKDAFCKFVNLQIKKRKLYDLSAFLGAKRKRVVKTYTLRQNGYNELMRERFDYTLYSGYERIVSLQYDDRYMALLEEEKLLNDFNRFMESPVEFLDNYADFYDLRSVKGFPHYFTHSPYHPTLLKSYYNHPQFVESYDSCVAHRLFTFTSNYIRKCRELNQMIKAENEIEWYSKHHSFA